MDPTPTTPNEYASLVAELEDGQLNTQLTADVAELVKALKDTALRGAPKPTGRITLRLDFTLDGGVVTIAAANTLTLPRPARRKSVFFPTKENKLSRDNPRQHELHLKSTPAGAERGHLKSV